MATKTDIEVHNNIMRMYASDEQNARLDGSYEKAFNIGVEETSRVTPCYGSVGYMRQ